MKSRGTMFIWFIFVQFLEIKIILKNLSAVNRISFALICYMQSNKQTYLDIWFVHDKGWLNGSLMIDKIIVIGQKKLESVYTWNNNTNTT